MTQLLLRTRSRFPAARVSVLLLAASVLLAASTASALVPDQDKDKSLSPYFIVKGADPGTEALPLKGTRADVDISGVIARVRVTQVYQNRGKKPLEAIYVFPGSTRAAVFGMQMTVGKRTIVAKINKREEARKIYEEAKKAGKSASLLEQQRPNVFQMNVANIMPGDEITVEMDYTELLVPEEGVYSFVYPAVVGPRYTEKTEDTAGPTDRFTKQPYTRKGKGPSYSWDVSVRLSAGVPVQNLGSPSHKIDSTVSGTRAGVQLADGEKGGDADFVLQYSLRGKAIDSGMLLYPGDKDGEQFFLTMVQPPVTMDDVAMPRREYIFIVDVSGSMHGTPIETAKGVMDELLSGMQPEDRFNVMTFSGGAKVLAPQSLPVTPENVRQIRESLSRERGSGSTRLLPALKQALAMPSEKGMSRTFVVVTDGYVSVEAEAFRLIRENLGKANLFAFGIGSSVNRHLIEGMARAGMGEPFVVLTRQGIGDAASRFQRYIAAPALTNIRVEYDGFDAYDVEPASVPDLFAQRPVVVFGKYKGAARGHVVVSGTTGSGRFEKRIDVSAADVSKENNALRYLWARHRVQALSDLESLSGGRTEEVKGAITDLGLKYNLMTKYTSFVAVDDAVRNKSGKSTTTNQPLPLPRGVSEQAVSMSGTGMGGGGVGYGGMGMGGLGAKRYKRVSRPSRVANAADKAESKPMSIRVAKHSVEGALKTGLVMRVVKMRVRSMAKCGSFPNRATVSLTIGADGRVSAASFVTSTGSKEVDKCFLRYLRRFRFPKSSGVTKVTFDLQP